MPGLLSFALAGAAQGAGQGIVERANQRREEALARLQREQELADRQQGREWQVEDRDLAYTRDLETEGRRRSYDVEDRNLAYGREDAERERGDARVSRDADFLATSAIGPQGQERVRHVADRLMGMGYPPHIAAGLVGNFMQESGTGLDTAAVGDNGNAIGIGQWNGPRMRALQDYAREQGVDWRDLDTQIDFFDLEMQTTESGARDRIMRATTPEEAALIASDAFWRPGTPHNERRQAYATQVADLLSQAAQVAADPESSPAAVEAAQGVLRNRGLAPQGTSATYEGQFWSDNGDSTSTRMGTNAATGQVEPVPGPDGQPLIQRDSTATAAAAGPGGAVNFDDAASLRKEFRADPIVSAFAAQAQAYSGIQTAASNPSPAGDTALIYSFMKLMDPGSVVRETEFGLAAQSGSIDQRTLGYFNRILNGERLTAEQRADFVGQARALYASAEESYTPVYEQYVSIAEANGFPVDQAVVDYRLRGLDEPAAPVGESGFVAAPGAAVPSAAAMPPAPASQADYDALPSGTVFIDPNGQRRVKP